MLKYLLRRTVEAHSEAVGRYADECSTYPGPTDSITCMRYPAIPEYVHRLQRPRKVTPVGENPFASKWNFQ